MPLSTADRSLDTITGGMQLFLHGIQMSENLMASNTDAALDQQDQYAN